jgi:uncharacterized protein GlcG (DUF336 family)
MKVCKSLGLEEARIIAEAGIEAVKKTGERGMTIAVVDRHGDPVCLMRMDGPGGGTVRMALAKACTAIATLWDTIDFRKFLPTEDVAPYELVPIPNFTCIPGGVLVRTKDGTVVGAVGTSGRQATGPGSDEEIARAAAKAFEKTKGFES